VVARASWDRRRAARYNERMFDWLKKLFAPSSSSPSGAAGVSGAVPGANGGNGHGGNGHGGHGPGGAARQPLPDADGDPTCVGQWAFLDRPGEERFLGFVYLDAQAGMSLRGGPESTLDPMTRPTHTFRLPYPGGLRALGRDEVAARRLPEPPDWVAHYGPQPRPRAPWRSDPALRERLHQSFPDDVQVLTHDGEPRRTQRGLEECWVRITGAFTGPARTALHNEKSGHPEADFARRDTAPGAVYAGTLLNAPHQLQTVRQGDTVLFLCGGGLDSPLLVTEQYLAERGEWAIAPCSKCGLSECLDPPPVMARTRFPAMPPDATMKQFTAFCPRCGGMQMLVHKP
jgi:hypothetical protein